MRPMNTSSRLGVPSRTSVTSRPARRAGRRPAPPCPPRRGEVEADPQLGGAGTAAPATYSRYAAPAARPRSGAGAVVAPPERLRTSLHRLGRARRRRAVRAPPPGRRLSRRVRHGELQGRAAGQPAHQRLGRVEREQLAVVHDRRRGRQLGRLVHVVGREDDRDAAGTQLPQPVPDEQARRRVESGASARRGTAPSERASAPVRSSRAAIWPPENMSGLIVGPIGQPELLEQLLAPERHGLGLPARRDRRRGRSGSGGSTASGRDCSAGARPRECRRAATGSATTSTPPTSARPPLGRTRVVSIADRRRLAGAVRPEQAEHLAPLDRELTRRRR